MAFLLRHKRIQRAALRGSEQRAFQEDRGTRAEDPVGTDQACSRNRTEWLRGGWHGVMHTVGAHQCLLPWESAHGQPELGRPHPWSGLSALSPDDLSAWPTGAQSRAADPGRLCPGNAHPHPFTHSFIYSRHIVTEHLRRPGPHLKAWGHKGDQGLVPAPFGKGDGTHSNTSSGIDICSAHLPSPESTEEGAASPAGPRDRVPEEVIPEPGLEG